MSAAYSFICRKEILLLELVSGVIAWSLRNSVHSWMIYLAFASVLFDIILHAQTGRWRLVVVYFIFIFNCIIFEKHLNDSDRENSLQ